jgi:hypothetical protein
MTPRVVVRVAHLQFRAGLVLSIPRRQPDGAWVITRDANQPTFPS